MNKTVRRLIPFVLIVCIFCTALSSCKPSEEARQNFNGKLSEKATWLKNLTADTVVKVGVVDIVYGVAPGTLASCYYSTDKTEIAGFISFYSNLEIEQVDSSVIDGKNGGGGKNYVFTYADGSTDIVYFRHGYYVVGSEVFKAKSTGKYEYKDTFERYLRFVDSDKISNVFTNTEDVQCVGTTEAVGDFRFKRIETEEDAYLSSTHYIEVSFGKIYILSETRFCVKFYNELKYFELIDGQSFRDFITPKV